MTEIQTLETDIHENQRIHDTCKRLLVHIVDGKPGTGSVGLQWLHDTHEDYEALSRVHALRREHRPVPDSLRHRMDIRGLSVHAIDETEAFVGLEFLEALDATMSFLEESNPQAIRNRELMENPEYVDLASRANIEFLDFFIKMHSHLGVHTDDLISLFDDIFDEQNLGQELKMRGLTHFSRGILAALGGYIQLSLRLKDGTFILPTLDQDLHSSVDLIHESSDHIYFFEIKTTCPDTMAHLVDLTNTQKLEALEDRISTIADPKERKRRYGSLKKLERFALEEQKHQQKTVKAFWLEIPVE